MNGVARLAIDVTLRDAFALLRRDWPLTLSIAAVFCFLPSFIYFGFVPYSVIPEQAGDTPASMLGTFMLSGVVIPMVVLGTFSFVGMLMIIRVWFQPGGSLVLDALRYSAAILPVVVAAHIMISSASIAGLMLLLIPGFYVIARTTLVLPALADEPQASPLDAWREGWALADRNVVPLLLLVIMMAMISISLAIALAMFDGTMDEAAPAVPTLMIGISNGVVGLVGAMLNAAVAAAAYRQLRVPGAHEIFS